MRSPCCVLITAATACLFFTGCAKAPKTAQAADVNAQAATGDQKEHKLAPDFTLKDVNNVKVKLSDYKGKVVLLDFWATWCGPCKIEIPWFMEFENQFKDRCFAVLGVSMDEGGWNDVRPYIEERKINYRILLGNDEVGQAYGGVDSLPTTLLIDRSGRIAQIHVGLEKGKNEIRDEIESLLRADPQARSSAPTVIPAWLAGAK